MLLAGDTTTGALAAFFAALTALGFCAAGSMISLSGHRLPLTSSNPSSAESSRSTRIAIVALGVSNARFCNQTPPKALRLRER